MRPAGYYTMHEIGFLEELLNELAESYFPYVQDRNLAVNEVRI